MYTRPRYAVYHANDLLAMLMPQASSWYEDRSRSFTHVADVVAPWSRSLPSPTTSITPGQATWRSSGTPLMLHFDPARSETSL